MKFRSVVDNHDNASRVMLAEGDLNKEHFNALCEWLAAECRNKQVVLSLTKVEIMTSQLLEMINQIVNFLTITGNEVIICDVNPATAAIVTNFTDGINFKTARDFKHAVTLF